MGELATAYYKEEGRRVKMRIEKKSYSSLELSVRYNFKARRLTITFFYCIFSSLSSLSRCPRFATFLVVVILLLLGQV